ncbi:MAG: peptide ABC transporter substrate-binding protein [Caldilinea sp. CFX5]|nr:peptide ABC transporter substrate-binding protein [Caldilinea sp. CFX5]
MQHWTQDAEQVKLFMQRSAAAGVSRRNFMKILAASATTAALAACAPAGAPAPTESGSGETAAPAAGEMLPDEQQIMRMPSTNEPASHDFNFDLYNNGFTELFAGLTRFNTDYEPVPYVAESFSISDDGTVYTFKFTPGLTWTNGDPVTAADFEWSFKRQLDPASGAPYAAFLFDIKNGEALNTGADGITPDDVGVKAIDDTTLEITLEGPRGYFPTVMAYAAALPAHRPSVEKFGEKWTEAANIVTNGPWKLTSWEHDSQYTAERNDDFKLEPKAKLRKLIRQIIASDAQLAAYEANEVDRTQQVPVAEIKRLQADPALAQELHTFSLTGTFYLAPSYSMAPFDVKEVRQALNHAIDRETIVNSVLQGVGQVAYTFVPPDSPGYVDPAQYGWVGELTDYNPQKAMDLLKGTPYEGGQNWPEVKITYRSDELGGISGLVVQAIQAMLKENLNMDVTLEGLENAVFRSSMWEHKNQLTYVRWYMDYPDPNNNHFLVWYSSRSSGSRHEYKDADYDAMLEKAAGAPTMEERMAIYTEAEKRMIEDGAATYVYYPFGVSLYKPWVQGLPVSSTGLAVQDWNIYFGLPQEVYIVDHPDRPQLS